MFNINKYKYQRISIPFQLNLQILMFLRTISLHDSPNTFGDLIVEQRALELSQTFSVDQNRNINNLYSPVSSSQDDGAEFSLQNHLANHQLNQNRLFSQNLNQNYERRGEEEISSQTTEENLNITFQHFERELLSESNNVFIISRSNHFNEEEFFEAIDFLFKELNNPKIIPKFKHFLNRINTKCAICFGKIKRNQTICKTECRHKFHKNCLERWTDRNPTCPLCRLTFK